jgi:type VI protein secretion system component VasF
MTTRFRDGDRVRISEDYAALHELWRQRDLHTLRGRAGTVSRVLPPVVEVLFDRRHPRGRDVIVTFHNSDCLEMLKRPRGPRRKEAEP